MPDWLIIFLCNNQAMKNLYEKIFENYLRSESTVLVGSGGSGKTYFIVNQLVPYLKEKGVNCQYFVDCNALAKMSSDIDFLILDEIETFIDKDFLEKRHPEEDPYYTDKYLGEVAVWHEKLKKIKTPSLFIITRNENEEIENLVNNLKVMDWGVRVNCLRFNNYGEK